MGQYLEFFWAAWARTESALALLGVAGISISAMVAAAYALFKWLGEKWLTQRFAEHLEAYKSEQARELERLRHKINGVFDRTKRLHDREYDVLPDVWAKLVDAKIWADAYLAHFQQYADIGRMSDSDLDEFLAQSPFSRSNQGNKIIGK